MDAPTDELMRELHRIRTSGVSRRRIAEASEGRLTEAQLGRMEYGSGPRVDEVEALRDVLGKVREEANIKSTKSGRKSVINSASKPGSEGGELDLETAKQTMITAGDLLARARRARSEQRRTELIEQAREVLTVAA